MTSIFLDDTLKEHRARLRRRNARNKNYVYCVLLGIFIGLFISAIILDYIFVK